MAEFKIDGRMTVKTLKEKFKKEFEGTLRVYNGREKADDSATLAAIRTGDAKGGELVCRASRTVGSFEKEMMEVFGIKVQVASPDDWVLALDGITLANLKNIPKQARKADMESLVAYKRKNSQTENDSDTQVKENTGKVLLDGKYKSLPIIDIKFKEVDWELNEENIEARREDLNELGVVYVKAGEDDFEVVVIADDIIDGLYQAIDEVKHFINEGYEKVKVYYTTACEFYGEDEECADIEVFGHVLSSLAFCEDNDYCYDLDSPVICRAVWDEHVQVWVTDDCGNHDCELNIDVDLLIEYKKDASKFVDKNEGLTPKMQCMNAKGEYLFDIPEDLTPYKLYPNGLIRVKLEEEWKYGAINIKGEEVIPCKYDSMGDFASNGLAEIEIDGKYGFINENGEEVIPCKYDYAGKFASNGLAYVEIDGKYGYINEKGEEVIPFKYDSACDFDLNGLACIEIDGKYGFINENGKEVIPCKYDSAGYFASNGLAEVEIDGKYGFINENGEEVIPCKYDIVRFFTSNGLVRVGIGCKYGFTNENGEEVIPCKYDSAGDFASNGLACVAIDGKCGFTNENGEEVIPCEYESVDDFASNGLASVRVDGKYGFINEVGAIVIPCKYDYAGYFASNGLASVKVDGKYGFINEVGVEVIPCKYDSTNSSSKELIAIELDGRYGCVNMKGEEVIPCKYVDLYIIENLIFVKG